MLWLTVLIEYGFIWSPYVKSTSNVPLLRILAKSTSIWIFEPLAGVQSISITASISSSFMLTVILGGQIPASLLSGSSERLFDSPLDTSVVDVDLTSMDVSSVRMFHVLSKLSNSTFTS